MYGCGRHVVVHVYNLSCTMYACRILLVGDHGGEVAELARLRDIDARLGDGGQGYIYIYIYIHTYIHAYIHIDIYIYRERER